MSQDPSDAVQVYTELRFSKNHYTAVRTHGQVTGLISHEEWVRLPPPQPLGLRIVRCRPNRFAKLCADKTVWHQRLARPSIRGVTPRDNSDYGQLIVVRETL